MGARAALEKMSPTRSHGRLQMEPCVAFGPWAFGQGEAGTEWRFRLEPAGEQRRPLIPDIAFVSNERLGAPTDEELEAHAPAPNVASEILSPRDERRDVESKIDVYLHA